MFPTRPDQWVAATVAALTRRVGMLEQRTQNIDSGTLLQTLTGTIDAAYTPGSGNPMVLLTGAAATTGPYPYVSGYVPAPSDSVLLVPSGTTYVIAGLVHPTTAYSALSAQTTVASSSAEAVIASLTIPAGDAVAGAVYRIRAWGVASVTATPTFIFRSRIGGVTGPEIADSGFRTASSGISNHTWRVELDLACLSPGSSGSFFGQQTVAEAISVAAGPPFAPAVLQDGTGTVTTDSTVAKVLCVTVQWGTASASNTLTCRGFIAERAT